MSFKNHRIIKFIPLLLVMILLAAGLSYPQRLTGKLTGTVADEEGIPLPGVSVEISSPSMMGVRTETTTDKGVYRFVNLPPGIYKIIFSLEGFQKITRENIRIIVGGTVTENITLKQTTIEESITVTAEPPIVDVTKSGMSTTYGKDELEKMPTGRFSLFDVVKMAPGVQQTSEYTDRNVAYGSNMESNAYWLDGVDISNPEIGIGWHYISAETFDEVETTGIGTPAEYGQFTGAVVNVVTKSGGNRFEGGVSYYGQYDSLTGDNNPKDKIAWKSIDPAEAYSYKRDTFYYLAFTLGGPIVKDKVWFFANYEKFEDTSSFWLSDPEYPTEWVGDGVFFKLTSQITPQHKLVASFYYEYFEVPDTQTPWLEKEALGNEVGKTPTWNLLYTWLISNNAFFELKYAGFRGKDDYIPMHSDYDTPARYDGYTGLTTEGLSWPWYYRVGRDQANAHLSYYAEDFLAGDHDFKAGVQYNRGSSDCWGGYAGGRYYYDYYGYPYYMYAQDVFYYGGRVDSIAAFIDDSWKISDRLTVNLGLRFDHSNGHIPAFPVMDGWNKTDQKSPALDDLIVWNSISPRIGLVFQLTPDQKTVLKASYGRYYDALHIANWEWPGPNVSDWYMWAYNWDTEAYDILIDFIPGEMDYSIDPDLQNPYADQFSIGLERELFPDFSVGALFMYKKEKNLIGWEDIGATYEQTQLEASDGQTYTVWNQTSDLGSNEYTITNPKDYEQTYKAGIFTLTKRYSHDWMLNASLTISKNDGLNMMAHSQFQQAMIWYAGDYGKDPNDLINATGLLQNDRRWMLKVQAGYNFPGDILASFLFGYQQGTPYPTFVNVFGLNQDPYGSGRRILANPRNDDDRMDKWSRLDFRIQKTFRLYDTLRLSAILDVFNLFNSDLVTSYASYNTWGENYMEPDEILFPRRLQIGLRLEF